MEEKLCNEQHAFRKNRSSHTALSAFTKYVYKEVDKRNTKVVAAFIDMKKAFNSCNPNILTSKLKTEFNVKGKLLRIFHEFLNGRVFRIGDNCTYYKADLGIPQGSCVGPLGFCVYINSLGQRLSVPFLLYADDIVIFCSGTSVEECLQILEREMLILIDWCNEHQMMINFSKSNYMVFSKLRNVKAPAKMTIGDKYSIERVSEFRYLGVILDENLSFDKHYDNVRRKVAQRISYLHGIRKYLDLYAIKILVNAYIHSIMDYCIDIWAVQTRKKLWEMQKLVDNFLLSFYFGSKSFKKSNSVNIDYNKLWKDFNFLTFPERIDFVLLKNVYHRVRNGEEVIISGERKDTPQLNNTAHSSCFYQKSYMYRAISLWNKLPRGLAFSEMPFGAFVRKIREDIIKKRDDVFVYY